jgi:aldose 1-epimerase
VPPGDPARLSLAEVSMTVAPYDSEVAATPAPVPTAAAASLSGPSFLLESAGARAEVGTLAAVLRSLSVDGVQLTEPVGPDVVAPMGCGMVLAPWPNRVRDARWTLDGERQQLDITEPSFGNASHGLLRNTGYRLLAQTPASVTLGALIAPQHGWPFLMDTTAHYELDAEGLSVTHSVVNLSERRAPWAVGAHPYFRVGEVPTEQLTVTLTGSVRLEVDDRWNAVAQHPVDGGFDLRDGRPLAGLDMNTAYGQLANADGRADVAWLTAPDGSSTTLWADPAFGWVQGYAPSAFPRPAGPGPAIALEPMTAPPDALNSGTGLIWLEPGESWSGSWGVRYSRKGHA